MPEGFPTVGIIGGGQLARMTQTPAIALGVGLDVLGQSEADSAHLSIGTVATPDDAAKIPDWARGVDVVTFDHEHVPLDIVREMERSGVAVYPSSSALEHAQDKAVMRARLGAAGFPMPRWAVVTRADELWEYPIVLKTARGGYDGKGVRVVDSPDQAADVLAGPGVWLAEEKVDFVREVAVQIARSPHGQAVAYPPVETVQTDGICTQVIAPAPDLSVSAEAAQALALSIAKELDVVGMLAVEMFDTGSGLLINELAMRPHNSGHWTIEGAVTSQFENHLRAVLDLPLGDPRARQPFAVMANILGGDIPDLYSAYKHVLAHDPQVKVHLYGKEVRPGRKVGHVTVVGSDVNDLRTRAQHAADYFQGVIDE